MFNTNVRPVCLPTGISTFLDSAIIVGWEILNDSSIKFKKSTITLLSLDSCKNDRLTTNTIDGQIQICIKMDECLVSNNTYMISPNLTIKYMNFRIALWQ